LLWADRAGREGDSIGEPGQYANPTVSPDGRRVAYDVADPRGGKVDIWIRDLTRGVSLRLTFGAGTNSAPVWSPDGTTIVFASTRGSRTGPDLYAKPTSGQGAETLLFDDEAPKIATDWSRDGRYIAFTSGGGGAAQSLWVLPTFGDKKPMKVAGGDFGAGGGVFSPDGRYIAYRSNESGRNEIYVQPFPDATGKWQISSGGAVDPSWRADGKELYFRALDQKIMAVDIDARQAFQAATPRVLFQANLQTAGASRNRYSPAAAGDRFLLFAPLSRDAIAPTTVVLNWDAALSR
jgi:Tol biopolymer transport system component